MIGRTIAIGWIILVIVALGLFIGFELYSHIILGLTLTEQAGFLLLPNSINANATATNMIKIKLQGRLNAEVPFNQTVSLPLHGTYQANIALDTPVPLQFVIHYQNTVPIHAYANIQGTSELVTGHHWFLPSFKLRARIPLNFNLPVSLTVPVDTHIQFVYNGPISMDLNQTLAAPINTTLHTHLELDKEITTPVLASFGLRIYPPRTPTAVFLNSDLRLPLKSLQLRPTQ